MAYPTNTREKTRQKCSRSGPARGVGEVDGWVYQGPPEDANFQPWMGLAPAMLQLPI